jgi:hypothetical protein
LEDRGEDGGADMPLKMTIWGNSWCKARRHADPVPSIPNSNLGILMLYNEMAQKYITDVKTTIL